MHVIKNVSQPFTLHRDKALLRRYTVARDKQTDRQTDRRTNNRQTVSQSGRLSPVRCFGRLGWHPGSLRETYTIRALSGVTHHLRHVRSVQWKFTHHIQTAAIPSGATGHFRQSLSSNTMSDPQYFRLRPQLWHDDGEHDDGKLG